MSKLVNPGLWGQIEKRCAELKFGTIELTLIVHQGIATDYKGMLAKESFRCIPEKGRELIE